MSDDQTPVGLSTIVMQQWYCNKIGCFFLYKNGVRVDQKFADSKDDPGFNGVKVEKFQVDRIVSEKSGRLMRNNYLANKDLLVEIRKSRADGKMTDKLANMLLLLTHRLARASNFRNYTWIDEMRQDGMLLLMEKYLKFDEEVGKNPFSYYTTVLTNSYISRIKSEKKQSDIKNKIMLENGMSASHDFMEKHKNEDLY